jgi:hypothetical protein
MTVADLDSVTAFFIALVLDVEGTQSRGRRALGHRDRHSGRSHRNRHVAVNEGQEI